MAILKMESSIKLKQLCKIQKILLGRRASGAPRGDWQILTGRICSGRLGYFSATSYTNARTLGTCPSFEHEVTCYHAGVSCCHQLAIAPGHMADIVAVVCVPTLAAPTHTGR